MKKQLLISLSILLLLFFGTALVVLYGRGYRFGLENGKIDIAGTGMLVATSDPDGAQVFINNHLTTATDNTINLPPGDYTIRIFKEGYFPWEKEIKVKEEVVSEAEALLFLTAPKLESITAIGVDNPTLDPSQTRLAYTVSSQSARKNGIYILDMTQRPVLTLQSASTQIVDDTIDRFSKATFTWSPDGRQLLTTITEELRTPTTYLLNTTSFNDNPQDITATLTSLQTTWENEKTDKEEARTATFKSSLRSLAAKHFTVIAYSPDETKVLYVASKSATLPLIIQPRHIGIDTLREDRSIKEGSVYVYDMKDDANFKITASLTDYLEEKTLISPLSWFPDSKHLVYVHDKKIDIIEYDGSNATTTYAGPFLDNYVFPWPNGSKIVVLTNLGNPSINPNLYTISLK